MAIIVFDCSRHKQNDPLGASLKKSLGRQGFAKMFIPKKNRILIYECLFKHGVLVAKKDYNLPKHHELETVRNLEVIKALQSLKSRGYVKENFAWQHYNWFFAK